MLNIPLRKLTGRTEEEMFTNQTGFGMDKSHYVLQLVAKADSSTRLVIPAPGPKTARYRLIQEPSIGQDID